MQVCTYSDLRQSSNLSFAPLSYNHDDYWHPVGGAVEMEMVIKMIEDVFQHLCGLQHHTRMHLFATVVMYLQS